MNDNTTKISLAKALKLKNRLAGRLSKVGTDIAAWNSVLQEQVGQVNVAALVQEYEKISDALIKLKGLIFRSNVPIQEKIFEKTELASRIAFLAYLPTKSGIERHSYQNTSVEYVAFLTKKEVDSTTRTLEKRIDNIQDEIDEFNNSTKITVPQFWLDMAS